MDITTAIANERRELAVMLDSLEPAQWDAPTLCAGWRVLEVAAHMSMGFRYSLPRMVLELIKARGDINRTADRRARQESATLSTAVLVSAIRDNAGHPWKPLVGGITEVVADTHRLPQGRPSGKGRWPWSSRPTGTAPRSPSPATTPRMPGVADLAYLRHSTDNQTDARQRHALTTLLAGGAPVYEDPAPPAGNSPSTARA
ncbi:maleylpyruvate isomerase N-terminal domain-containing protein [Microbispora sp. NPDC046973]|uniref:maleylpyruvate isomerase N-terminal domain-containing protein n=1 Tax=Microbispora sp. NPDC046973 TaxID=3155022 RepID=UPI0033C24024